MAKCPNCDYKLKITDWRPECPQCGVNLMYYRMEERLREDADKAELEYARSQPRIDRLKASIYGSKWAIIRLVLLVLPIGALMIPLGSVSLTLPFYSSTKTVNAIAIYNVVKSMDVGRLLQLTGSELIGKDVAMFLAAVVLILLALVLMIVQLIFVVMAFGEKWFPRNMIVASVGIALVTAAGLLFGAACRGFNAALPGVFEGGLNVFGLLAVDITFLLIIAVNLVIKQKKIEVAYTDVSEYFLPYHERPSVIAAQKAAQEAAESAADQT